MKFIFTTNKIEIKKTQNIKNGLVERRGFGDIVISAAMESHAFRPEKSSSNKANIAKLELKNDPKLSDKVVRQKNDEVWTKIQNRQKYINELKPKAITKSSQDIIGKVDADMVRVIEAFSFFYTNIYKTNPPVTASSSMSYDVDSLAKAYTIYVIETGKAEPSQNELFQNTGVSQSTWSRNFKSLEFWKKISDYVDRVLTTNETATLNIDRLSKIQSENYEKEYPEYPKPGEIAFDSDQGGGEEEILFNAEITKYSKYDKNKLIKEIFKKRPLARLKDLEMESEEDLCKLLTLIT